MATRLETDSMGEVQLPEGALFGAQTQRALNHAGIVPGRGMPAAFLHALALIKAAAARANAEVGALTPAVATAIADAAESVAAGQHDEAFPVPEPAPVEDVPTGALEVLRFQPENLERKLRKQRGLQRLRQRVEPLVHPHRHQLVI